MDIPGFSIERKIGDGDYASVYLAMQQDEGRVVALKVVKPKLSLDPEFRAGFDKLAKELIALDHKNLITIYAGGVVADKCYLAMEYFPAGTLRHRLLVGLSLGKSLKLTHCIADAITFLHQSDFVHNGLKPSNVFLRDNGEAVLGDPEIAKRLIWEKNNQALSPETLSQALYLSPEQAQGKHPDERSDFYSLGLILYELISKKRPFQSKDPKSLAEMHANDSAPPLGDKAYLQPIIDQLLTKIPEERIENAQQYHEWVKTVQEDAGESSLGKASEHEQTIIKQSDSVGGFANAKWAALGILVVGIGFGFFFLTSGEEDVSADKVQLSTAEVVTKKQDAVVEENAIVNENEQVKATLLNEAKELLAAGKLIYPEGNNAFARYQEVLAISANDAAANAGLLQIQKHIIALANQRIASGEFASAQTLITDSISNFPTSTLLINLKHTIKRSREEAENRKRQAAEQLAKDRQSAAQQQKLAEQQRLLEAEQLQKEQQRQREEQVQREIEAQHRIVERRLQAEKEQRKAQEQSQMEAEQQRQAEAQRQVTEQRRLQQVKEQQRRNEQKRKQTAERRRIAEQKKAVERRRIAEQQRRAEQHRAEQRRLEQQRQAEENHRLEQQRHAQEQHRLEQQRKLAQEQQRKEEEKRKAKKEEKPKMPRFFGTF